jgi:hypothetical protein
MKAALDRSQALTAALLAGVLFAALTLGGCASTP